MPKGDFVGEFELYVLLAVAHMRDEAYSVGIRQEIERRTRRTVSIGAVHATLTRLEDKGLLRFRVSDPQPVPGGNGGELLRLLAPGGRAVRHSAGMLARMLDVLSPSLRGL